MFLWQRDDYLIQKVEDEYYACARTRLSPVMGLSGYPFAPPPRALLIVPVKKIIHFFPFFFCHEEAQHPFFWSGVFQLLTLACKSSSASFNFRSLHPLMFHSERMCDINSKDERLQDAAERLFPTQLRRYHRFLYWSCYPPHHHHTCSNKYYLGFRKQNFKERKRFIVHRQNWTLTIFP